MSKHESKYETIYISEVRKKQEKEEDRDEYNNYVDFTGNISTYEKYLGPLGDNQDYSEAGPVESDLIYNDYPDGNPVSSYFRYIHICVWIETISFAFSGHRLSPKQVNNDENNDLSYQPHEDGDGEREIYKSSSIKVSNTELVVIYLLQGCKAVDFLGIFTPQ